MHMRISILSGAALLACGSLVFAGPLSRRQETNNNLLAPINQDSTNFLLNTPLILASLPTLPDANSFPAGPVVLPDDPISNVGNTLTAVTLPGIGSSTGDDTTQVSQGLTNFGDPPPNPKIFDFSDPSFPEAEIKQKIGSMDPQNPNSMDYCIYRLLINIATGTSKLQFYTCGSGGWTEFRDVLLSTPTPGFGAVRLGNDRVLSVMNRLHRYRVKNSAGKLVDLPVFSLLNSYKDQWTRALRNTFRYTVSKDIVREQQLDELEDAIANDQGNSSSLTPDPE